MAAILQTTHSDTFLNENVWITIKISLKFVPKGPINDILVLVQIMAWRRPGDKPLSEPMMVRLPTHIYVTKPHQVISLSPGGMWLYSWFSSYHVLQLLVLHIFTRTCSISRWWSLRGITWACIARQHEEWRRKTLDWVFGQEDTQGSSRNSEHWVWIATS